jgi:hypothetical protein
MRNLYIALILIFVVTTGISTLKAQQFIWKTGMHTFFDNREYYNNYVQPQSMLGARTFASGGFAVDNSNSFLAGVDYLYEFGSKSNISDVLPIIYFNHQSKYAQVKMGAFPRKDLICLPYVLQIDTFQYYRPNVEGIFLKFFKPWGYQKLWLNWTSRQTDSDRETFLIGGTGIINPNKWFIRYDFIMYHFAGTAIKHPNDHIRDNGGLVFSAGLDLSDLTDMDSLVIQSGLTMSYDRIRNVYDLDFRTGNITEIVGCYKVVGLRSTTYFGQGQTQMVGDGLYSAKFYSRLDIFLNLFRKSKVKSLVEFSLHFLPEVVDVSQRFVIYITFDGKSKHIKMPE